MDKVWKSGGISRKTKLRLFESVVISVLLYGCETWKGLREVEQRLRRFESNCLRRIMDIRWQDMVSKEELRRRTGQQSVVEKIRMHRWRYYGHVLRMEEWRMPRQVLGWTPDGRRRVGRPKDTWRRTLRRDMVENELEEDDVVELARDRPEWRRFVAALWTT
jgi:hypothetical protein